MKPKFNSPGQYEKQYTEAEALRDQKIYLDSLLKKMKKDKPKGERGGSMPLKSKGAVISYIIGACLTFFGIYRYLLFYHSMYREALTFIGIGVLFAIIGILFSELGRIDRLQTKIDHAQKEIEYFEDRLLDEYPELNKLRDDK